MFPVSEEGIERQDFIDWINLSSIEVWYVEANNWKKNSHHVYFSQNQTLRVKSVLKFKIMEGLLVHNRNSDLETGLAIKDSFIAKSGFNYQTGIRDFGSLKIVEGVSKGTASIFLTSLMVFDGQKKLLLDCEVGRLTNYSRETVRKMVLHGLITMLREATEKQGKHFDEMKIYELVDNQLKDAYYESSCHFQCP